MFGKPLPARDLPGTIQPMIRRLAVAAVLVSLGGTAVVGSVATAHTDEKPVASSAASAAAPGARAVAGNGAGPVASASLSRPLSAALTSGLAKPVGVQVTRPAVSSRLHLARPLHGAAAVRQLGSGLDVTAKLSGLSPAQVRHTLRTDPTMWVGTAGQLFVKEEKPAAPPSAVRATGATRATSATSATRATSAAGIARGATPAAATAASLSSLGAAPYPLDQTFSLHSDPGSNHTIYLDFSGVDVTSDSLWTGAGVPAGHYAGWDPMGDGDTVFDDSERTAIQDIWQRVAEDYAPFDVDVTTEEPAADALYRSDASDPTYGTRIVITDSDAAWNGACQRSCGGIANVGTIAAVDPDQTYADAFVFPAGTADLPAYIAQAAAHETGHTFGLTHQGDLPNTDLSSYDQGHGVWAPIMGASYYRPVSQWAKGEYAGANNQQDELAVIERSAPVRPDEAGDTPATATQVTSQTGYITDASDADYYALGSCPGPVTIDATPAAVGANLDIHLSVVDSTGATVADVDPATTEDDQVQTWPWLGSVYAPAADGLDAHLTNATLSGTGPYYAVVRGGGGEAGGAGDPTADYTAYGSLGAYTLNVSGCSTPATAPGAPTALNATPATDTGTSLAWGAPVRDGGSAVTEYDVSVDGGSWSSVGTATTWSDPTLTSGTHTFAVRALNAIGAGGPATTSTKTATVPGVISPIGHTKVYTANGQQWLSFTWNAPDDGGSPIEGYRIYQQGQYGWFLVWDGAPYGMDPQQIGIDFMPGTLNTVKLVAYNALGEGAGDPMQVVIPGPPQLWTGGTVATDDLTSTATVTVTPVDFDGGAPVTAYKVWLDDDTADTITVDPSGPMTATFTNVPEGPHTAWISAVNTYGATTQGRGFDQPPPAGAPDPVYNLDVSADRIARTIAATWTPGYNDGTHPVTGFEVSFDNGAWTAVPGGADATSWNASGITTGQHTVAIRALNDIGAGDSTQTPVTMPAPYTALGPVQNLTSTMFSDGQNAELTWDAPAARDTDAPLTGYEVRVNGTTVADVGDSTNYQLTGLSVGQPVHVQVVATNLVGDGDAGTGLTITPMTMPDAVSGLTVVPHPRAGTATVTWQPMTASGGGKIIGYDVVLDGQPAVRVTAATWTAQGLAMDSTNHMLTVQAVNGAWSGPPSFASFTMLTTPAAVTGLVVAPVGHDPSNLQLDATWKPGDNGGDAGTQSYKYALTSAGVAPGDNDWLAADQTSATLRAPGLGVYTFEVEALNGEGASDPASVQVVLANAPGAVTGLRVTPDAAHAAATVTWKAPATNGGAPITGYTVTVGSQTRSVAPGVTSARFTGLKLGTNYPVHVTAANAAGTGPQVTSAVKLTSPPGAVAVSVVPGAKGGPLTVTAKWSAAVANGAAISGYQVRVAVLNAAGKVTGTTAYAVGGSARALTVKLKAGKVKVSVRAKNLAGWGAFGAWSKVVAPR